MDRRTLLGLLAAAVAAEATPQAQSGVSPGAGRRIDGEGVIDGGRLTFKRRAGGYWPTVIGVLVAPEAEPTQPEHSGACWIYVSGPPESTVVQLKVNVFGNALVMGEAEWRLQ